MLPMMKKNHKMPVKTVGKVLLNY